MFNPLKSEDKTLRINRDEEAEMNNNFEENGLVKKKMDRKHFWSTKSVIKL